MSREPPKFSELSLHILDIAENSIDAGASLISISIVEDEPIQLEIADNGCGMTPELLEKAAECGFSTKTSGGFGLYILKKTALESGGSFELTSSPGSGTTVRASLRGLPIGNIPETIKAIMLSSDSADLLVTHTSPKLSVRLDTRDFGGMSRRALISRIMSELDEQYKV